MTYLCFFDFFDPICKNKYSNSLDDRGAASSEELRKRLLHEAGVAVLADIHFGKQVEGDGEHLRFSYASSFEAIDEGLSRMNDFIRKNKR